MSTCWERADILALVCDVQCVFVTSPCGIMCKVWYLIVSIPDRCHRSYLDSVVGYSLSVVAPIGILCLVLV